MTTDNVLTYKAIHDMLCKAGIRPSVQRIAVLSYVGNRKTHPTSDEIFTELSGRFPSLSRTTVYNSLHVLTEASLLRELEIEAGNKRYDLAPQPPHSHFICRSCGRIYDMAMPEGMQFTPPGGFSVDCVDVYVKGICPDCNK